MLVTKIFLEINLFSLLWLYLFWFFKGFALFLSEFFGIYYIVSLLLAVRILLGSSASFFCFLFSSLLLAFHILHGFSSLSLLLLLSPSLILAVCIPRCSLHVSLLYTWHGSLRSDIWNLLWTSWYQLVNHTWGANLMKSYFKPVSIQIC